MQMRTEFALHFLGTLGSTSHADDEIYFCAEGIHFMFTNFVPLHVGTNNDTVAGMNETLAINCQCVIGQVDSKQNTNKVWDDCSIWDDFHHKARCDPDSHQYQGKYISLLPGYDRMRHWSTIKYLCDVLHTKGILEMDCNNIINFICFAAFETNGIFLISSIVEKLVTSHCTSDTEFKKDYNRHRIYAALIFVAQCRNAVPCCESGYGSSNIPRFQFNDSGICVDLSFSKGSDLVIMDDDIKGIIKGKCWCVVEDLAKECFNLHSAVKSLDKRKRSDGVDTIGHRFYNRIQDIGGKGMGHEQAINFIQLASIFGFLPYDVINLVCVGPEMSNTYKAIIYFYKKTFDCNDHHCQDISEEEAQKHFSTAVQYIGSNLFSWNFTPAIVDNMLPILYTELDCCVDMNFSSELRDVVFLYEHRDGKLHHQQYRWKMDTNGKAFLQFLYVHKDGTIVLHGVSLLEVHRDGSEEATFGISLYWMDGFGRPWSGGVCQPLTHFLMPTKDR
jgi:hypothetical protein